MATFDTESDRDALHILPLDTVHLKNEGLQQARLIKNARLEGVVELFSGAEIGSGQIPPHELHEAFEFSGDGVQDLELIRALSVLPSYDVFTLRMELGRLGVGVARAATLNLSEAKCEALVPYMRHYTRPLAAAIFGNGTFSTGDGGDLMGIVANPDPLKTRNNLQKLAHAMEISIPEVPAFLEDYADLLRSAIYFQSNADRLEPLMLRFASEMQRMSGDPSLRSDQRLVRSCSLVHRRMDAIYTQTQGFLDLFEKKIVQMWMSPTGDRYLTLRSLTEGCYVHLGAALCGLSVKLQPWNAVSRRDATPRNEAEFIVRDTKEGLDRVPLIGRLVAAWIPLEERA